MKKRPILTALLVLITICATFFLIVLGLSYFGDQYSYGLASDRIAVIKIEGAILDSEPSIEKKVVVSMESIAASGGYYIACAADTLFANPGTLVGSIGVILQLENIEELLKKIGLKSKVIKSGKYKDIGSMTREMTEQEEAILQNFSDDIHSQFIDAVAEGRNMKREEVIKLADGRIFAGEQALQLGLIDNLGNLQDAIAMTAEMVGIEGEPKVIYPRKEKLSILDFIFQEAASSIVRIIERMIHDKINVYYLSPSF